MMISNGFIQRKPMEDLMEVLGAVKIDLKAFTDDFYKKICGAPRLSLSSIRSNF